MRALRHAIFPAALVLLPVTSPAQLAIPAQGPAVSKASEKDSLNAQRKVWSSLHFLKKRPDVPHIMRPVIARFKATFNKFAPVIPGDEWMAGVRVSFPVPGGPVSTKIAGMPECRASGWWCDLLAMSALWRTGEFAMAESLLVAALRQMNPAERCIWGDVSMLIDNTRERQKYEKMGCTERALFEEKLWWLSDPLFSTTGNERKVDHYARAVHLRLATELLVPEVDGLPYALRATRNATHRFSASNAPSMALNPPSNASEAQIAKFRGPDGILQVAFKSMREADYRTANFRKMETAIQHRGVGGPFTDGLPSLLQFVPSVAAIQSPFRSRAEDWNLTARPPLESGLSAIGPIVPIDAQHAYFFRNDSSRLVVVSEPRSSSLLNGTLMRAALSFMRSPSDAPVTYRIDKADRVEFSPVIKPDSLVVSLEAIALNRGGGRIRFGAIPPQNTGRVRASDVLLFNSGPNADPLRTLALDSAIKRAMPTTTFARSSSPGIYWEIYGLLQGETPGVEVSMRKLVSPRAVGLPQANSAQQNSLTIGWTGTNTSGDAIVPGQLVLDTSRLDPGYYELSLTVSVAAVQPATSKRVVLVR